MNSFIKMSDRLLSLPPYIFSELNAIKADAAKRGISLLSLAIGDPDQPTPAPIVNRFREEATKAENHLYSPYEGTAAFRTAVANWFTKRFGVTLDAEKEIVALIGSKEGVAHFSWAVCNPGDTALYPSPGYPVFETSCLLAGAKAVPMPLRPENGFLPNVDEVAALMKEHRPRYMILNFPSNPTSVVCPKERLAELVDLARRHEVIIGYDNAYSELYYDEANRPPSILEIPGAKDVAIEFHSLSKSFNMTGWRIGFAVGNPQLVAALTKMKTNIDSGPLLAVQAASVYALNNATELGKSVRDVYVERRKILTDGLSKLGIEFLKPEATFFCWAKVPKGQKSMAFVKQLIEEQGLVLTPGIGFGQEGDDFFRIAMTVPPEKIQDALDRLERFLK